MKKDKLLLLGLALGLSLSACGKSDYFECSNVVIDKTRIEETIHTHEIVAKYESNQAFPFSTQTADEKRHYYSYFFASYDAKMEDPVMPKYVTVHYSVNGTYYSADCKKVETIGSYESFKKIFLSKDKTQLKITNASFKPRSASKDKEVQGKTVGRLPLNEAGEVNSKFTVNISGTFETIIESTFIDVSSKDIQYTVFGE